MNNLTGVITQAPLTIIATTNTKTYDSTVSAAGIPTVVGLQGADTVTGLAEVYTDPNAGSGKTLSVSAYTVVDGFRGHNYSVTTITNTTGVINKATLTITAMTNTKTYDATTSAAAIPTVSGLIGTDTATGLAEVYTDPNVGTGKTLSVSAYTINDGNGGNNYTVTTVTNTTGVITKASLTITATTNTKTYDSTTSAAATPTVSGLHRHRLRHGPCRGLQRPQRWYRQDAQRQHLHHQRRQRRQQLRDHHGRQHDRRHHQGDGHDHGDHEHQDI